MFGTTAELNLTSKNKAEFLKAKFPWGFDYIGNSTQDFSVWDVADTAYAIRPPRGTEKRQTATNKFVEILEPRKFSTRPILKAMRLHQWAKNKLIFLVPTLVLEQLNLLDWLAVGLGFLCMGMLASGTYLINDILDIKLTANTRPKKDGPLQPALYQFLSAHLCLAYASLSLSG